jgi:hypothetical protein
MDTVRIGSMEVSRFVLGSNPFSGFSHQGHERDAAMVHYYSATRIKDVLRQAESLGVNTIVARGDHHMLRLLTEYWDEGGTLQLIGQTCPELGAPEATIRKMAAASARAVHVHGGYADHLLANGRLEELVSPVATARELGLIVGLAGHLPETHRWGMRHLDLDFHMCAYYSPIPRDKEAAHRAGLREVYLDEDRQAMAALIHELDTPAIHYKVMAAGRNEPKEAFAYVADALRPQDAVCVGVFPKDKPDMLAEDVRLLHEALAARANA